MALDGWLVRRPENVKISHYHRLFDLGYHEEYMKFIPCSEVPIEL